MYVIKRDGRQEKVHFDKITSRITRLCYALNPNFVDPVIVAQKVCLGVYRGVRTSELDELAAETAAHLTSIHPDYGLLAARIAISNLHKNTQKSFMDTMKRLYEYVNSRSGQASPMIDDKVYQFMCDNADALNGAIVYDRDFTFDYFGFKTLERSYLLRIDGKVMERPQHMVMRVACGIHCGDLAAAIETYDLMSCKWFTHASPTLFNAGTRYPQLSSCFLVSMKDDSIEGIYETLKCTALISKHAGGIGMAVSNIRATGSYIRGTNGTSNGLVPMLRVFNNTARYVDQGGGKRKGAFAVYLEPWHADVLAWLQLKKNHGIEEERARDLFYGLWIPDLFMQRVEADADWSLFCPNEAPGLNECWGDAFNELYIKYEGVKGKARKVIKARSLWQEILSAQMETGTPYMLFKDACNSKSNQQNLGTIKCSNLCTEVVQYTAVDEIAVCNLASINLSVFVDPVQHVFDFQKLFDVTKVVTRNLNRIIDINHYPVREAENSNFRHRPIGIGVQGLADAFIRMRFPFDSAEAKQLNRDIFETIYFAALTASHELAVKEGAYSSFTGSPLSQGKFQFDLWNVKASGVGGRWDWDEMKAKIMRDGVRNSLLLAPMPTASTSQILGNNECFEPYTSNLYVRRTLAGEFVCVNHHLLRDLIDLGLWSPTLKDKLIACNGSVQNIPEIPTHIKQLYKTVWEISQRTIVDLAAERAPFIDQSQSLNIHMVNCNFAKLTSLHFYAWKAGLKTGMYYLRTKAATDAIKFTIDPTLIKQMQQQQSTPAASPSPSPDSSSPSSSSSTAISPALQRQGSSGSATSWRQFTTLSSASLPLSLSPSHTISTAAATAAAVPTLPSSTHASAFVTPVKPTASSTSTTSSTQETKDEAEEEKENAEPKRRADSPSSIMSYTPPSTSTASSSSSSSSSSVVEGGSTMTIEEWRAMRKQQEEEMTCSLDNKEGCVMCSS